MWVQSECRLWLCLPTFHRVHWCGCAGPLSAQDLPRCRLWSSGRVFPPFCPPYCFMLVALLANMALFAILKAFLARFGVQMHICMG